MHNLLDKINFINTSNINIWFGLIQIQIRILITFKSDLIFTVIQQII